MSAIRRSAWLLPALTALALAWAGWLWGPGVRLHVGAPTDGGMVVGFHEREQGAFGANRWSGGTAQISLPSVRGPALLALPLIGPPGGARAELALGGRVAATLDLGERRHYTLLWDGRGAPDGVLRLGLRGHPRAAAGDPRELLALVGPLELRPLAGAALPPALPLALLALLATLSLAGLRLAGLQRGLALALACATGAALAAGWGWARLWVAPHLALTAAGLALVCLLLALARWGSRRQPALGQPELLALLAVMSAPIPLYLYLLYGPQHWLHANNLPILLLPCGLALLAGHGRARRVAAGALLLVALAAFGSTLLRIFSGDYASDFHAIYRGVAGLVRGDAPLYRLDALRDNPLGNTYKYPPTFALLFAPLTHLPFVPAIITWRAINLALLLASAAWLLRIYQVHWRSWSAAALLFLLCTLTPLTATINYGQIDIILLLLLVGGLAALRRGRYGLLGAWVGAGAAIKLYPAYLLGMALARRNTRALAGALAAGAAIGALSLLAFGWPIHAQFLSEVLPATGVGTGWVENQTFNGLLNRLRSPERVALVPDEGGAVRLASYAWALLLSALTAWLTRPQGGLRDDAAYGLWIAAMLLVLPAAWMHYQTLLLIPFFQAFILARDAGGLRWPTAAGYALAWLLIAQGNQWTFFDRSLHGPFWQLILSYKFYGLLVLYLAIARNAAARLAPAEAAAPQRGAQSRPVLAPARQPGE